ncbi:glycosyltransferase [Candidatus Acetothermia bacterium]|nr:glycosyltransferase [Candidatus Acetothermia bacterium]MBI3643588.1 glycosyltransferase [Candidatus Acetothermia bacterium]
MSLELKPLRPLFISPYAGALIDPSQKQSFGGMEVRALIFARGLAQKNGIAVKFGIFGERNGETSRFHELEIHHLCLSDYSYLREKIREFKQFADRSDEFPWVKIHKLDIKLLRLFPLMGFIFIRNRVIRGRPYRPIFRRELKAINANVTCLFKPGRLTSDLILSSQRLKRRTILFLTSNKDLEAHAYKNSKVLSATGEPGHACFLSIARADKVIVQTEYQLNLLWERFKRKGVLIRNPIDLTTHASGPSPLQDPYALWVGKADMKNKHPERCFALARAFPSTKFLIVMNRRNTVEYEKLMSEMPDNVFHVENVPFDEIEIYFQHAKVFLNTSDYEGFPNTFLQAGKYGVPILSYNVDPDSFIRRGGCGYCADGRMESMIEKFNILWNDEQHHKSASKRIREYVRENHDLKICSTLLESTLRDLL